MTPEEKERMLQKVEKRLLLLPWYVGEFINYLSDASANTLESYTRDYVDFFNWLISESFHPGPAKSISIHLLEKLRVKDIVGFEQYLLRRRKNRIDTVARKLASLRSLFHYLSQIAEDEEMYPYLHRNVMAKIDIKKERISETKRAEKIANRILIDNEINDFREFVAHDYGETLKINNETRKYNAHIRNRERDVALVSLILGSGLRISESLSIDTDSVDWRRNQADIVRKGDSGDVVTFSDIAARDMQDYLEIRQERYQPGDNKAFFLSWKTGKGGQTRRLTVRAAQKMFQKYADAFGKSRLSLHKLRHSFATNHYKENSDIALLKRILDHSNIDTTMIYTHVFDAQIRNSINKADK